MSNGDLEKPKAWVRGGVAGGLPQDAPAVLSSSIKFQARPKTAPSLFVSLLTPSADHSQA